AGSSGGGFGGDPGGHGPAGRPLSAPSRDGPRRGVELPVGSGPRGRLSVRGHGRFPSAVDGPSVHGGGAASGRQRLGGDRGRAPGPGGAGPAHGDRPRA